MNVYLVKYFLTNKTYSDGDLPHEIYWPAENKEAVLIAIVEHTYTVTKPITIELISSLQDYMNRHNID